MPRHIEIHDDMVEIFDKNPVRTVTLDDFIRSVETKSAIDSPRLPKTIAFMRQDESNQHGRIIQILTELEPAVRSLRMRNRRFRLSLPWTYFLYTFTTAQAIRQANTWQMGQVRVFWAQEQATNYESVLRTALIANCDHQGIICYGNTGVPVTLPLMTRIDRLTNEFYSTTFMHDSGTGAPWSSEEGNTLWARWERESANDAGAWRRFPEWDESIGDIGDNRGHMQRYTVQDLMGSTQLVPNPIIEGVIPELPANQVTFGAAEEWLRRPEIGPVNRHRLLIALQNQHAEDPAFIEAPPVPAEGTMVEEGGTPIGPNEAPV